MNPYQKIVKDGVIVQPGYIDTEAKFHQLTQGINLKGKKVSDVGSNLGVMCSLATQAGAAAIGFDTDRECIKQARELFPEIEFECVQAEEVYGNYDIIIASAVLHYVDLDKTFKQFSRCAKQVLCDVWLHESQVPIFALTNRDIFIPSRSAFIHIASKYFKKIEEKGQALSPDNSKRYIFHLSEPIETKPEAILISGNGGIGKSTLARTSFDYKHLELDYIFLNWRYDNRAMLMDIPWFADTMRGKHQRAYVDYYVNYLKNWLKFCVNRDIVIEGYDLVFDDLRELILELLSDWKVTEIRL